MKETQNGQRKSILMTATRREKSMKIPPPLCAPPRCTLGQISKICKETSNLMWWSLIEFISVLFDCLLKVIMYNSKPQNQMCDWNIKCFCFVLQKILNQALYMTHTFDSEVSLLFWLLWPTVCHAFSIGKTVLGSSSALRKNKIYIFFHYNPNILWQD